MTTIYKSVTLLTGEKFILPPDSVLIAAESVDDLDSTCDLPILENVNCYTTVVGFGGVDGGGVFGGGRSQLWEIKSFNGGESNAGGDVLLLGFTTKVANLPPVDTLFDTPYRFRELMGIVIDDNPALDTFKTELVTKLQGVFSIQVAQDLSDTGRRYKLYVNIKTTNSMAENLFMKVSTDGNVYNYVPFRLYSVVAEEGHLNLPECLESSS